MEVQRAAQSDLGRLILLISPCRPASSPDSVSGRLHSGPDPGPGADVGDETASAATTARLQQPQDARTGAPRLGGRATAAGMGTTAGAGKAARQGRLGEDARRRPVRDDSGSTRDGGRHGDGAGSGRSGASPGRTRDGRRPGRPREGCVLSLSPWFFSPRICSLSPSGVRSSELNLWVIAVCWHDLGVVVVTFLLVAFAPGRRSAKGAAAPGEGAGGGTAAPGRRAEGPNHAPGRRGAGGTAAPGSRADGRNDSPEQRAAGPGSGYLSADLLPAPNEGF
ncbi:uncharacterized protein LOC112891666 [Panicum hallii]|jgi:hypothetical protein|uniref:uncharacterized protein LOC112891666 n=1 Tax=Panicum hallii TaxID=206008 RepID=UPI000DF4E187|nr:uncharacterized protein LOC112891666 [Panicum hallii]